jgi:hypothetical protein
MVLAELSVGPDCFLWRTDIRRPDPDRRLGPNSASLVYNETCARLRAIQVIENAGFQNRYSFGSDRSSRQSMLSGTATLIAEAAALQVRKSVIFSSNTGVW